MPAILAWSMRQASEVHMTIEIDANVPAHIEAQARTAYERCHAEDTFADLKRRASFSREDKGLLRDWIDLAAGRDQEARDGLAADRRPMPVVPV